MSSFLKPFVQVSSRVGMRLMLCAAILSGLLFAATVPVKAQYGYPYGNNYGNSYVPSFSIVSVTTDSSVTIQTAYFPPNEKFTVRMGEYGTLGINGIVVGTTDSGSGGFFQATYTIPDALKGRPLIAIRMDNENGYFYSYNWFTNRAAPAYTPVPPNGTPVPPYTYCYSNYQMYCNCGSSYCGIPTFLVTKVVRDNTVTIRTRNFPPNETFTVRMGYYGSYGFWGVVVGTTDSGTGGTFEATYTIPDSLKGQQRIAIRMDSSTGYYYSYNWFWNYNATVP